MKIQYLILKAEVFKLIQILKMKYYIIAGEASGDLHGSNLMKALYKEDVNANIRFWVAI
jgi:hypothetical protein